MEIIRNNEIIQKFTFQLRIHAEDHSRNTQTYQH